ncbi:hypothetical protein JB92DRAFT_3065076, partial [Gautieria morchelliformis]
RSLLSSCRTGKRREETENDGLIMSCRVLLVWRVGCTMEADGGGIVWKTANCDDNM